MLKIAILSDVHSNLPALRAVLADIDALSADHIYCLGDLVDFAPWTNEVIELIRSRDIPTVMGNHDERIAFDIPVIRLEKHSEEEASARLEAIAFTRKDISEANKDYLRNLPLQMRLDFLINGKALNILLVHASSRCIDEYIYEDHEEEDILEMLDTNSADVMVIGHTHLSYIRHLKNGKTLVNCGSVGRTKEERQLACYLLLTINFGDGHNSVNFELRKLTYDLEETVREIRKSTIPDYYADFLLSGLNS